MKTISPHDFQHTLRQGARIYQTMVNAGWQPPVIRAMLDEQAKHADCQVFAPLAGFDMLSRACTDEAIEADALIRWRDAYEMATHKIVRALKP